MIDDSALLHANRVYDPAKAREYYLRTRKLKGRQGGSDNVPSGNRSGSRPGPTPPKAKSQALAAEKAKLEARFDRLKEILAQAVEAAKARSGVEPTQKKESSTKTEKADTKPLTSTEKKDKAKDAKAKYEKENGNKKVPLSQDIATLQKQITDIKAKIKAALEDAQKKPQSKAKSDSEFEKDQTASKGR